MPCRQGSIIKLDYIWRQRGFYRNKCSALRLCTTATIDLLWLKPIVIMNIKV